MSEISKEQLLGYGGALAASLIEADYKKSVEGYNATMNTIRETGNLASSIYGKQFQGALLNIEGEKAKLETALNSFQKATQESFDLGDLYQSGNLPDLANATKEDIYGYYQDTIQDMTNEADWYKTKSQEVNTFLNVTLPEVDSYFMGGADILGGGTDPYYMDIADYTWSGFENYMDSRGYDMSPTIDHDNNPSTPEIENLQLSYLRGAYDVLEDQAATKAAEYNKIKALSDKYIYESRTAELDLRAKTIASSDDLYDGYVELEKDHRNYITSVVEDNMPRVRTGAFISRLSVMNTQKNFLQQNYNLAIQNNDEEGIDSYADQIEKKDEQINIHLKNQSFKLVNNSGMTDDKFKKHYQISESVMRGLSDMVQAQVNGVNAPLSRYFDENELSYLTGEKGLYGIEGKIIENGVINTDLHKQLMDTHNRYRLNWMDGMDVVTSMYHGYWNTIKSANNQDPSGLLFSEGVANAYLLLQNQIDPSTIDANNPDGVDFSGVDERQWRFIEETFGVSREQFKRQGSTYLDLQNNLQNVQSLKLGELNYQNTLASGHDLDEQKYKDYVFKQEEEQNRTDFQVQFEKDREELAATMSVPMAEQMKDMTDFSSTQTLEDYLGSLVPMGQATNLLNQPTAVVANQNANIGQVQKEVELQKAVNHLLNTQDEDYIALILKEFPGFDENLNPGDPGYAQNAQGFLDAYLTVQKNTSAPLTPPPRPGVPIAEEEDFEDETYEIVDPESEYTADELEAALNQIKGLPASIGQSSVVSINSMAGDSLMMIPFTRGDEDLVANVQETYGYIENNAFSLVDDFNNPDLSREEKKNPSVQKFQEYYNLSVASASQGLNAYMSDWPEVEEDGYFGDDTQAAFERVFGFHPSDTGYEDDSTMEPFSFEGFYQAGVDKNEPEEFHNQVIDEKVYSNMMYGRTDEEEYQQVDAVEALNNGWEDEVTYNRFDGNYHVDELLDPAYHSKDDYSILRDKMYNLFVGEWEKSHGFNTAMSRTEWETQFGEYTFREYVKQMELMFKIDLTNSAEGSFGREFWDGWVFKDRDTDIYFRGGG